MDLNELLYGFCGNETILNSSLLYEQLPVLTSCFLDTLPVWISCGFLWIASIPYLVFLIRSRRKPLPFSYLHLVKMVLAVGLLCFADLHYSFRQMTGETCTGMEVVPTAGQVSMGLKFATFLLAAVLLQMQKRHGAVTSGVTFFFWGLTMTAETCRLYAYVIGQVQCRTQVIFYVYYGGIWTQLILHCFADKREIVQKSSDKREILQKSSDKRETVKVPCPQDQASNLNRITYSWMSSLVYRIYRKTFKRESMWQQTENLKSSVIGPRLEKRWKHNQHTAKQREKHLIQMSPCQPETTFDDQLSVSITSETTPLIPSKHQPQNVTSCPQRLNASLMKTLWRVYCWDFLTIFTLSWISVALFFIQPVLLRFLIEYIDTRSSSAATNPLWQGVFFAVAMVIVMEFSSMFYNSQCHHTTSLGLRMKHSLMYLIYKKALTVCKSENKISVGEVVNMMSVDCIRIQDAIYFFYYGPNCFIFVAGASYLLYTTVGGVATLGGMVVMFLIIPLNGFIVRSQNIIQQELLYLKGLRLRLMNEILCGIKVLKMYAWEFAFVRKVEDIREKEVKLLKRNATLMAIGTAVAYHSTYVVHFFLILIYVLLKEDRYVDSSTVFVSLSVVVILKYPLTVLPTMLNGCVQIVVVESSSRFGGWMRTLTDEDGAKMELGPRSIRPAGAAGYNTLCLVEELGLEADIVKVSRGEPAAQNRFVFANGKLNKLPNKAASFFTKQAPFSKPLYRYGIHDILADAGLLEDESVYDFMSRRFDEDLARYAVDPMCRGIFAGDCRKLSVKSALPMLYEAERLRGSVILGMLKKSRSGYPKQRECKLQERCRQEQWTTYSFKQGLQHLSDTVKDFISTSPQIELVNNTLCDRVSFQDGKASVHVNGEIIAADHVFSSIYAADLAKLISPEYPSIAEDLEKIPAVHTVVVCVEFDGHVDPPTPGFGHLTPSFEDKAVLGVIYDSCTFPQHDRTDKLSARYTVMMGGSWYADLQRCVPSMTDADLGQYAVKALQAQLGTSETPVKIHVEQLHNCIPQYVLGHSKVLERLFSQTQQLPLSLVGSSYRGPAVNDCINNARLEAYVSLQRIQNFLCCSDLDDVEPVYIKSSEYSICVRDGTFSWDSENPKPYLSDVNFKIRQGELIAVVGYCGSGKSSLIAALLGEMRKHGGQVQIKGSVAYVPQEAWIQNLSLRDNVLFGKEYTHNKYWKVIECCCLKPDLAMFDNGDKTELGEKGTNISGGQKQRISVARAVYNNADVYFLDDPLSAVDAHVGKDLFKNVIGNSGLLKNKTRVLVTHAIHWLPLVDNIIVMDDGRISETGTYDELMTHNGAFAQFLLQHLHNEPMEDLDDPEIQWIRENIREQVESVTSEGGTSDVSDHPLRAKQKKIRKKKPKRRHLSSMSVSQSVHVNASTHVSMTAHEGRGLTSDETVQEGSVKLHVVVDYLKAVGYIWAAVSVLTLLLYHVISVYSMFWLTFWTEDPFLKNKNNTVYPEYIDTSTYYLVGYAVMGIVQGIVIFTSFKIALSKLITASALLHNNMLLRILRSPMSFFDTVPVGRILNRFAADIDALDTKLPEAYRLWIHMVLSTLASIVVMVISTPIFILMILPAIVIICVLMKVYLPTARKLRRCEAVTRSPIYNHFSETLTGSTVIRTFKCCNRFISESFSCQDTNSTLFFAVNSGSRWVAVRLELMGNVILLGATLLVVLSDNLNGGQLGLSVTYAIQITFALNTMVYSLMEMETNGVAAERVHEYTNLPSEAEWTFDNKLPKESWPTTGRIEYTSYSTKYRPGLELVLKGISFSINHGEKIGVVGRTGAGKSSLALSLFRIVEASGGTIYIDGEDVSQFGLHTLRSKITILPQDPVLFSGSLRMNVDPMEEFSDVAIWRAIEYAHLKVFVKKQNCGLDYDCGEAGQNLSVGQRQLVCLARALLNKTNILVLDEATAAVDMETDALIQQTIRTQFTDCTIITIAHRLNTIMDYDRVMVLDKGLVREFAAPRELLKDKEGIFHSMAKDARLI